MNSLNFGCEQKAMMSNEEEKRCPLCAEEMDWTDQQFQPCKCGYQMCVWCWHHIIDMAEKEETDGRCPACRTIYEKEKIVAMQANCEKTMTKISNRKTKPPKAKPKTNEVKKDLTNVRVIQRKMAYVIGLPLSLADEDILVRKEYFGQYGKVTKISLSRTAGGAIQQFINDTCSVYITYSKEEEALRCIQSVHGFFLEGKLLRASFGTAKYCHAWLKNMPCNNPACLYLHSIGSDEDSFGKDEVAAVHTRGRVQQIVGATNMVKRSGSVLPPPVDDIYNSSGSTFTDKSTLRIGISDTVHGSVNSNGDITCQLPRKEKEGAMAVPHKTTTFVDIVGRFNCAVSDKDANIPDEPLREDSLLSDNQGSIDSYGSNCRSFFLHPSYPANISDDSGATALLQEKTHKMNGFAMGLNPIHNCDDEASLCINSGLNDSCQEMNFRNSAKSDRIYRSSNSFSNEEIVEHLRRIEDDNSTYDKENSVLDTVESSIISNIMSIGFDSCENSLTMPNGLSGGSSWSSLNSDQSGSSSVKRDGFASQMPGSIFPEYTDKEQYSYKPQYSVNSAQILAPPGFSILSRDPPPGFSTIERTSSLPRAASGTRLSNPSFSTTLLQPSSTRLNSSSDAVDFFNPTIVSHDKGKQTNGFKSPSSEARPMDESRLWLLMQQSAAARNFAPQTTHMGDGLAELDQVYGSSSRLVEERQNYDPSFFTHISQQQFANGHVSNTNGYRHSLNEGPHNGEMGTKELQRNERLGVNKYFPGYGDRMFSSGDVYTRVFGL